MAHPPMPPLSTQIMLTYISDMLGPGDDCPPSYVHRCTVTGGDYLALFLTRAYGAPFADYMGN